MWKLHQHKVSGHASSNLFTCISRLLHIQLPHISVVPYVTSGELRFGQPPSNDALRFHLHPELRKHLRSNGLLGNILSAPSFSNATSQSSVCQPALAPPYWKACNQTFKIGDRVIFTGLKHGSIGSNVASRGPSFGNCGKVVIFINSDSKTIGVRFDVPVSEGCNLGGYCEADHGFLCDGSELCIDEEGQIFRPSKDSDANRRIILLMKHAENCSVEKNEAYIGMKAMVNKLPDNVFVIGSHIQKESAKQRNGNDQKLEKLIKIFPEKISIEMPEDQKLLDELKHQLDRDAELLRVRENRARLHHAIVRNGLHIEDIEAICVTDQILTDEDAEKVVTWAYGSLLSANPPSYTKLLSHESILRGLNDLRAVQKLPKDIAIDNEFEKRVLEEVIFHNKIGVKFDDIGALDNIKDSLEELVMLPLQRPEYFHKGQLRKPCKGILLFGPPGTGKTMLAKAVATESGANFFNITTSSIISKWTGDSEKFVKAIFSLARKMAPSIVFIDEVDSLLGKRRDQEHELMRKIKNEFMLNWDGLGTKDSERVLVLAATNRPFDLDEAAIRRMPRRFMLNLPDVPNRFKILRVILAKEELDHDVDLDEIVRVTDGFSGSDLKELCTVAVYGPLREINKKRKFKYQEMPTELRPVNMGDFKYARDQVKASVPKNSRIMAELLQWNELYGAGAVRGSSGGNAAYNNMYI